jgi:hypothetical protein
MNDADTYDRVFTLLAVAADARRCKARLTKLRRLEKRVAVALPKLEAAKAAHAARKAELDLRDAALKVREQACAEAEREYVNQLPPGKPNDPNLFGTLTRAPYTNG